VTISWNNVILECPRCLNMFMASTFRVLQVGQRTWGTRCRCGEIIEFSTDYMDSVQLWAQPNVANRIRKIEGYRVHVEGLTR